GGAAGDHSGSQRGTPLGARAMSDTLKANKSRFQPFLREGKQGRRDDNERLLQQAARAFRASFLLLRVSCGLPLPAVRNRRFLPRSSSNPHAKRTSFRRGGHGRSGGLFVGVPCSPSAR